jgi:geranylgeranyl diphosphate synthase type II
MITTKNLQEEFTSSLSNFISTYPTTGLFEPIRYLLELRGKRIRPILALSVSKAEGSQTLDGLPAAMAVELFHNFTLMHDDIMDNAPLRRGNQTVHEKFSQSAAILSGDALFTAAYQALETAPPIHLPKLLKLFNRTSMEVCEGQQSDLEFENKSDVTQEMYLEMIRLKTSVLLAASCAMGAICSGSSDERVELWYEFGEKLGLAFQIQDDYLDTFGVESTTGKKVGGDILADKKTFLFIHAVSSGELPETNGMENNKKVQVIREQMQARGSDLAAKNLMKKYSDEASSALQTLALDSNTQKWFEELLFSVTERVS